MPIRYELNGTGGGGGGGTLTSINADVTPAQTLSTSETGTNFTISNPGGGSHLFNLPIASAINTGKLSAADWATFNAKIDGTGNPNSVAFWQTSTALGSNIFFTRDPGNGILTNTPGYTTTTSPATTNRYVDSINGNDANSGSAPGVGSAWATINHALAQQPQVLGGVYQINLADGTYAESVFFKDILANAADATEGNNIVKIVGNIITPSNVVIQSGTNPITIMNGRSILVLDGVTLDGNATSNGGVLCFNGTFDLINVNIQNTTIGIQMNENSRGRWLSGATGGNVSATVSGFTLSRGASFSLQRNISITNFTSFGFSLSANALLGITSGVTTLTLTGDLIAGAIAGFQATTGAVISSSATTINISNCTSGANGYAFRCINRGVITFNNGVTFNLTNCTRAGQITSSSYFQDGSTGNTWNYLGGTASEWLIDSNALIFAPGTFSSAVVNMSNQAGYILGSWWNKQGTITGDFTLNSQSYSIKCNAIIPIAVTLPLASTVGVGRTYIITDISGNAAANNITITCSGGDLIDGAATFPINTNYGTATVEAISTGWSVI